MRVSARDPKFCRVLGPRFPLFQMLHLGPLPVRSQHPRWFWGLPHVSGAGAAHAPESGMGGGGSPRAPAASSAGTPPRRCSVTPSPHHFSPLILQIRLTKQGVTTDVGQYRAPTSGTGLESKRRRHRSLLAARPCSHTAGRTFPLLGPGAEVTCRPFAPPAWITFPRGAPGCSPFGLPRPPPTSLCSKIKP